MTTAVIRLCGLASGEPTPYDGMYVREYDPRRAPDDPESELCCHLVVTSDPERALQFPSAMDALAFWRRDTGRRLRDGTPERPLTAFTVEIAGTTLWSGRV
jgi:hypothetical protein